MVEVVGLEPTLLYPKQAPCQLGYTSREYDVKDLNLRHPHS